MEKQKTAPARQKKEWTFAIHTLGCKVNTYESDAISGRLRAAGLREVPFSEKADVYLINTCTVTNIADRKSRQMLHRARKQNPDALVVAAGCYVDAAMQNESMHALLEDCAVDLFVSNKDKGGAAAMILERLSGVKASAAPLFVTELDGHTRAFLKVQDGCNQFCSYCIIPYVRGRIRTRPIADVIAEVETLAARGVTEIVLNGIHLSSYGKDWLRETGGKQAEEDNTLSLEKKTDGAAAFSSEEKTAEAFEAGTERTEHAAKEQRTVKDAAAGSMCAEDDIVNTKDAPLLVLIRAVSSVDGISRIRLGSLEPRLMTEDFVRELAKLGKVCPQFHLSLQSGSDTVLKRMNRHYDTELYREVCARLRRYYQKPAITTDIIVGFPGETEEEFQESLDFLREIRFYEAHVFKYSRRAGTVADRMDGQVSEQTKALRSEQLIQAAAELSHAYRERFLGETVTFLAEEAITQDGATYLTGYTPEYVRCVMKVEAERAKQAQGRLISGKAIEIFQEKPVDESLLLR